MRGCICTKGGGKGKEWRNRVQQREGRDKGREEDVIGKPAKLVQ
jgi:hypothetical protein